MSRNQSSLVPGSADSQASRPTRSGTTRQGLIVWVGAVVFSLAIGGYWYYRYAAHEIQREKYNDLKAIADLKVGEIVRWRRERAGDARVHAARSLFRTVVLQRIGASSGTEPKNGLRAHMEALCDSYGYSDVILAEPDGTLLLSLDPRLTALDPTAKELVARTIASGGVEFGDFFRCPARNKVYLDVASPIQNADGRPAAVLILRSDPEDHLYPLIQSWPLPSETAETLILRKDGDDVLFLNSLRHSSAPPLSFHIPLSKADVPAVRAALGQFGECEGFDYRGVKVLADIRAVPNAPWFMVTKVDAGEILAEARYQGYVVILFVVLATLVTGTVAALVFHNGRRALYENLYHAERRRREAQEEIRTTLYSIGDAVIATDAAGRVTRMNRVAEQLTGWPEADALGEPLDCVFHVVNEETGAEVENPVARVMREGAVVGLANHTALVARDGVEHPIADSGAPIRDDEGRITGVVLVFRDQAAERAAQKALTDSEVRYRRLFETAKDGILILDGDTGAVFDVNPFLVDMLGLPHEHVVGKSIWELGFFRDIAANQAKFSVLQEQGYVRYEDLPLETADGRQIDVEFVSNVYSVNGRRVIQCNVRDITARRRAERALQESEGFRQSILDSVAPHVAVLDRNGVIVAVNEPWRRFALENKTEDGLPARRTEVGVNYLEVCRESTGESSEGAMAAYDGIRAVLDGQRANFSIEYGCHSPQEKRWFTMTAAPLGTPEKGVVISHVNITKLIEAEETLRRERDFAESLVETAQAVVLVLDTEGRIVRFNPYMEEISGYRLQEVRGRDWFDTFLPPQTRESTREFFLKAVTGVPTRGRVNPIVTRDGSQREIEWYDKTLKDSGGNVVGLIVIGQDVTERKRTEEQVRRQMEELQRWHNLTLGREERILELKGEVNRLLARLGEPPRYEPQDG